jgi:hypothetical protein
MPIPEYLQMTIDKALTYYTDAINNGVPYERARMVAHVFLKEDDKKEFNELVEGIDMIHRAGRIRRMF